MQKYKSNITTTSGAAVRGVPVLVIDEDGNNAALFLDRAGTVPAPNPLTTGPDGVFYFYAVNGRYSIRTTVDGVTITDDDVVLMMDPEEITVAGPIAEAVAAAQAAATAAELVVANSGIPVLVAAAQNAVVDANNAASLSTTAANNAAISKAGADSARDASVAAKNAAEAALDSFDDRYLGAKAVAPTTDNDGGALLTGALYWDTSLPGMRSWNGSVWVTLSAATKASVGLANVDNTSDANKPVSTATQNALYGKEPTIAAGPVTQYWRGDKTWRDFFTDVRAATLTGLSTATNAVITATDTVLSALGKLQKQVSDNLATLTSHTGNTSNPHGVTKVQVGLGNVDNTSDANKPVSTAQAAAIAARYGKNNVLGTVSQSAGVPTGAVIERGSNANGEYVRWADGTQICTRFIPIGGTPAITLAYGALFQSNVDITWAYPAAFIAQPVIGGAVTGGLAFTWLGLGSAGSSQTGANFVAFSPVAYGAATATTLFATGRWF